MRHGCGDVGLATSLLGKRVVYSRDLNPCLFVHRFLVRAAHSFTPYDAELRPVAKGPHSAESSITRSTSMFSHCPNRQLRCVYSYWPTITVLAATHVHSIAALAGPVSSKHCGSACPADRVQMRSGATVAKRLHWGGGRGSHLAEIANFSCGRHLNYDFQFPYFFLVSVYLKS